MGWLSTGAGMLGAGLNAVKNRALRAQAESLLEDAPAIRISPNVQEYLESWAGTGNAYNAILANLERGAYTADKELLAGDCLATLARLYPDTNLVSAEEKMTGGKKKSRLREPGEVVEGLTTLLLDNWEYVSDSVKYDIELFLSYAVYMVNKVIEQTHDPAVLGGAPKTSLFPMRIMILLDAIGRLEQLNASRNIRVSKPEYTTYGEDEIAYIRSKLKSPKSEWQRGEYDWEEDSCWVVTAYYGSPFDPNVLAIRDLRGSLLAKPILGPAVARINGAYHHVGRTAFGRWWQARLSEPRPNGPRLLSGVLCRYLLLASALTGRTGQNRPQAPRDDLRE